MFHRILSLEQFQSSLHPHFHQNPDQFRIRIRCAVPVKKQGKGGPHRVIQFLSKGRISRPLGPFQQEQGLLPVAVQKGHEAEVAVGASVWVFQFLRGQFMSQLGQLLGSVLYDLGEQISLFWKKK